MRATVLALALCAAPALVAAQADQTARLVDALGMADMIEILAEEGQSSAPSIAEGLFPDRQTASWMTTVADIYDPDVQLAAISADMAEIIGDEDISAMLGFLESDAGQTIMQLELSARRAFSDPTVQEAAEEAWADGADIAPAKDALVRAFIDTNDLIDANVEGAQKANIAFALGLIDGGAFPMSQPEALAEELYGGTEGMARDTFDWLYSYLMTAYSPLEEATLADYVALSETEAGAVVNAAIMGAFDAMFTRVSYDLGMAAAAIMIAQEL
ncbi:MAG: hypothetical protein AAFO93_05980 [Pseudomonadota bacterium]